MYFNSYGQLVPDNYLAHHGIQGQKWGVQNGPPYPLAPGDHSAREVRYKGQNAGTLESWKTKKTSKIQKKYNNKVSRIDKKIAKIEKGNHLGKLEAKRAGVEYKKSSYDKKLSSIDKKLSKKEDVVDYDKRDKLKDKRAKVAYKQNAQNEKLKKLDAKIAKTAKRENLAALKTKRAQAIYKQSVKESKVLNTTEKQLKTRKRVKIALGIVGGVSVAVLAAYAFNKWGKGKAADRMHRYRDQHEFLSKQVNSRHPILAREDPSEFSTSLLKELNGKLGDDLRIATQSNRKAYDMLDIYNNGTLMQKILTQLKGF